MEIKKIKSIKTDKMIIKKLDDKRKSTNYCILSNLRSCNPITPIFVYELSNSASIDSSCSIRGNHRVIQSMLIVDDMFNFIISQSRNIC